MRSLGGSDQVKVFQQFWHTQVWHGHLQAHVQLGDRILLFLQFVALKATRKMSLHTCGSQTCCTGAQRPGCTCPNAWSGAGPI